MKKLLLERMTATLAVVRLSIAQERGAILFSGRWTRRLSDQLRKLFPVLLRGDQKVRHYCFHQSDTILVIDTDPHKQQEADMPISNSATHKLQGLQMIHGSGLVDMDDDVDGGTFMKPTTDDWGHLLPISSYRSPVSPIVMILLVQDRYPTKQLRTVFHSWFLSLLVDSRFKSRFAASLREALHTVL